MKKNVMFLGMMMVSTIIFAQSRPTESNGMTKHAERLKKELSLSEDQFTKMKAIRMKYAERYAKIHKDTALTQGTARKQRQSLRTEQEAELKSLLTTDQWAKYTALKAKRMEDRKKHHRGGKPEKG